MRILLITRKTIFMIMLVALPILLVACSASDQQSGAAAPVSESPAQIEYSQQISMPIEPSPTSPSAPPITSPTQSNDKDDSDEPILPDSVSGYVTATIQADAEFVYAGSGNQSALTSDSPENSMIGAVIVSFMPGG